MSRRNVPLPFDLTLQKQQSGGGETLSEVRQELAVFILEKERVLEKVLGSGSKNAHLYLKSAFINHCVGLARKPGKDPVRHLYKRASDALRNSPLFYTSSNKQMRKSTFSMVRESSEMPLLTEEDFPEIRPPDQALCALTHEQVKRKKVLLELAAHFWKEVSRIWGNEPVRVNLLDFVSWLDKEIVSAGSIRVAVPLNNADFVHRRSDVEALPSQIHFDPEEVKQWAANFCRLLTPKERTLFYLRHGASLGLKQIAARTGYRGSSGPKYLLETAEHKLKCFLRDLPWLSPDDLNEEAFALFRDTLISLLKKSALEP